MIQSDFVLDAKGLACPMPIVKTKKKMNDLESGQVLEIHATDKGSTADLQAWAKSSGHEYLGTEAEGDVLIHFLRKDAKEIEKDSVVIPEISLKDFTEKVKKDKDLTILDVREVEEFDEAHIPGAKLIPLGEVENRAKELNKEDEIYLICHSGRRSEIAAQTMTKKGFKKLYNVVPGMSDWTGETQKKENDK